MRAVALLAQGEPALLTDLPDPIAQPDGVVIEVRAASVNGFDAFQASGGLMGMMPHDLPTIIGRDLAGVVRSVGGREDIAVGDEVIAFIPSTPPLHDGAWAELAARGPDLIVVRKPAELEWTAAAALPLAGGTAFASIEAVDPQPGDSVLIMGATGGVGAFAIQLAVARGARVLASAKPGPDSDFVRSLGAAEVIDYTLSGLGDTVRALTPGGLTGLIDGVSRAEAFGPLAALVRDGGRAATTLGAADVEALAARGVTATNVSGAPSAETVTMLAAQAASGALVVPIQATYPLEAFGEALQAFAAGAQGKLVLRVS